MTVHFTPLQKNTGNKAVHFTPLNTTSENKGIHFTPIQQMPIAAPVLDMNEMMPTQFNVVVPQDVNKSKVKSENRRLDEELIDAAARGLASGSSGLLSGAAPTIIDIFGTPTIPTTGAAAGMAVPVETPQQKQARQQIKTDVRDKAKLLWEVSKNPAIASQRKDIAAKAVNVIGETLPYMTASTIGYLTAGPMGGFAVGSLIEGNSAYRTAIDSGVDEGKAKQIGLGVGIVNGAIEAVGGKAAEKLLASVTAKIKNKILRGVADFGVGTAIEALEEGSQEVSTMTGESSYRDIDWNEITNRTLSSMAGGAFLGGVMKGGSTAIRLGDRGQGIGYREQEIENKQPATPQTDIGTPPVPNISELKVDFANRSDLPYLDEKTGIIIPADEVDKSQMFRRRIKEPEKQPEGVRDELMAEIDALDAEFRAKTGQTPLEAQTQEVTTQTSDEGEIEAYNEGENQNVTQEVKRQSEKGKILEDVTVSDESQNAERSMLNDLQQQINARQAGQTDEQLSGITNRRRKTLIKETAGRIADNDIYKNELGALEQLENEIGPGFYYVDPVFAGELEQIIGKRKGTPTKLQKMFTTNRSDVVNKGAIPWDTAAQERGHDDIDISEFIQRVKDAVENKGKYAGLNSTALERAAASGEPGLNMLAEKLRMLQEGFSDLEINNMIVAWANENDIPITEIADEFINPQKFEELLTMPDEQVEAEIERIATEQILQEEQLDGFKAAKEILTANGLEDVEVETKSDLSDLADESEVIPFEQGSKITGAAITEGQRQIIYIALGGDVETGYHEAYHILRTRLGKPDIRILEQSFEDEEAEARAFARFVKTDKAASTKLRMVFKKLLEILKKIKAALASKGFRTVEDIFGEIAQGKADLSDRSDTSEVKSKLETSGDKLRRDAERNAKIQARKARLKAQRAAAKPKVSRRRIKINIIDTTPALREDLIEKPKSNEAPVTENPPPGKGNKKKLYLRRGFAEENRVELKRTLRDAIGEKAEMLVEGFNKAIQSMSSRLNKISPQLTAQVRRYIFDSYTRTIALTKDCVPMVKAWKKMAHNDKRDFIFWARNAQTDQIMELVRKYKCEKQYEQYRAAMDEIYQAGNQVGLEIMYRQDYWPRVVKNFRGLTRYLQTTEKWAPIQQALRKRQEAAGGRQLTEDEQSQVINTLLRGYQVEGVKLTRPGAARERTIDVFDRNIEQFYYGLDESIAMYIQTMTQAIGAREFFGKTTKEITNLKAHRSRLRTSLYKLTTRQGLKKGWTEDAYKDHISKRWKLLEEVEKRLEKFKTQTFEDSVGYYTLELLKDNQITSDQQRELSQILSAIFEPKGMRSGGFWQSFTKLAYIDVLAQPTVALTQLEELGLAFYQDKIKSLGATARASIGKSKIKLADIGVDDINQYMDDLGFKRIGDALLKPMRITDKLGKEAFINTAVDKYRSMAKSKTLNAGFLNKMRNLFGPEYQQVISDLKTGNVSDNVKFLAFCELSDVQPISIAETPQYYAQGGNMRIFYMLRSFTLRRLDMLRNKAAAVKNARSVPEFAKAFYDLTKLIFIMTAFGVGKDFLRKAFLGQEIEDDDLFDSVVDNMLQYSMLSRYTASRAVNEGIGSTIGGEIAPPFKTIDAVIRDIQKGELERSVRSIPQIGENLYWWFGAGSEPKKNKKKNNPFK